jgi:DUF917 family protein
MQMQFEDIDRIAEGAAFLGTGGGGDPYMGSLLCKQAFRRYGAPTIVDVQDLDDNANVYVAAMMGAPSVMLEKLMDVRELDDAVSALERYTGKPADVILAAEMGGSNSMLPVALAAERGLPLVDGDGMGRAFPELQMVTYHVMGVNASPMAMANEHGEVVLIDARDSQQTEMKGRQMVMQMGGRAAISLYPMSGADAKRAVIGGTLTLARDIGRALLEGRAEGNAFERLLRFLRGTEYYRHAEVLFEGKITDLQRSVTGGFTQGLCEITGSNDSDARMSIQFQNENLVAYKNGELAAVVPDLICILDAETAAPITSESLKFGQRVKVIGASVPPIMRSPAALDVFGPQAFGLKEPFAPLETLISPSGTDIQNVAND